MYPGEIWRQWASAAQSDPICFNFMSGLDHLQPDHIAKVETFRKIVHADSVEILTRASQKMVITLGSDVYCRLPSLVTPWKRC